MYFRWFNDFSHDSRKKSWMIFNVCTSSSPYIQALSSINVYMYSCQWFLPVSLKSIKETVEEEFKICLQKVVS